MLQLLCGLGLLNLFALSFPFAFLVLIIGLHVEAGPHQRRHERTFMGGYR